MVDAGIAAAFVGERMGFLAAATTRGKRMALGL
jgi:predicted small integral membrane protein